MKIKVGIFGGSGYGGAELLRILLFHPRAEVTLVTANEHAGKAVGEVHRNLNGLTDLRFVKAPEDFESLSELDCVFLALPHGQALEIAPRLPAGVKVVDLSGDFRLRDADEFREHYGREHTATELQREFVYGLTEINREAIAKARLVSATPAALRRRRCWGSRRWPRRARSRGAWWLTRRPARRARARSRRRTRTTRSARTRSTPTSLSRTSTCRR